MHCLALCGRSHLPASSRRRRTRASVRTGVLEIAFGSRPWPGPLPKGAGLRAGTSARSARAHGGGGPASRERSRAGGATLAPRPPALPRLRSPGPHTRRAHRRPACPRPSRPRPSRASAARRHGVRSHSEKDSGFRPSAEPRVSEAEAVRAFVGTGVGYRLPCGRHRRLGRLGRRRLSAEVSPDGAFPLRRRLLSPHHRTNSVQHKTGV